MTWLGELEHHTFPFFLDKRVNDSPMFYCVSESYYRTMNNGIAWNVRHITGSGEKYQRLGPCTFGNGKLYMCTIDIESGSYAGTGSILQSIDGGDSWTKLEYNFDKSESIHKWSSIHIIEPNRIFLGGSYQTTSSDYYDPTASLYLAFMIASDDTGSTWTTLLKDDYHVSPWDAFNLNLGRMDVKTIISEPSGAGHKLYVGLRSQNLDTAQPYVMSSSDYGTSWFDMGLYEPGPVPVYSASVCMKLAVSKSLYAAMAADSYGPTMGLYKYVSGTLWTRLLSDPITDVAISGTTFLVARQGGIFNGGWEVSYNSGQTWTSFGNPNDAGNTCFIQNGIMYVGTTNAFFRSNDNGHTWFSASCFPSGAGYSEFVYQVFGEPQGRSTSQYMIGSFTRSLATQ